MPTDEPADRQIEKGLRWLSAGKFGSVLAVGAATLALIACAVCIVVGFTLYALDVMYRTLRTP